MRIWKRLRNFAAKAFNWLGGDSSNGPWYGSRYGTFDNYNRRHAEVNSAVAACILWLCRAIVEPPVAIVEDVGGKEEKSFDHDIIALLRTPRMQGNQKVSGRRLMYGIVYSLSMDGNAYAHIERNSSRILGIRYLNHANVEVKAKDGELEGYWVWTQSGREFVPPDDMLHIATGIDPQNEFLGVSPLKSVLREVMTDNQIADYSNGLLKHPIISMVVSPAEPGVDIDDDQAEIIMKAFSAKAAGKNAGGIAMPNIPLNINKVGYSPEEMALDKLTKRPETRIPAVFGIAPILIGLQAGLERSTMSNYKEAREATTEQTLVPLWSQIADDMTAQLLRQVEPRESITLQFDLSKVRSLQEDQNEVWKRATEAFRNDAITRSEFKEMIGLDSLPEDEVYSSQARLETSLRLTAAMSAGNRGQEDA